MKDRKEKQVFNRSHRFYESRPQAKGKRGETLFCENCIALQDELERLREEVRQLTNQCIGKARCVMA